MRQKVAGPAKKMCWPHCGYFFVPCRPQLSWSCVYAACSQNKLKEKQASNFHCLAFFIIFVSRWPKRTNCTAQREVDELAKLAINFAEEWFHFVPGNGDTLICSDWSSPGGSQWANPGHGVDSIEPTYKINNSINNIRVEFCGESEKKKKEMETPERQRPRPTGKAHWAIEGPGQRESSLDTCLTQYKKRKLNPKKKCIGEDKGRQIRLHWTFN